VGMGRAPDDEQVRAERGVPGPAGWFPPQRCRRRAMAGGKIPPAIAL
jgi:hypothetical protein